METTIGKFMERIVARKLARDFDDRKVLPANQGDFRRGNAHGNMQLHMHRMCMEDSRGNNKH